MHYSVYIQCIILYIFNALFCIYFFDLCYFSCHQQKQVTYLSLSMLKDKQTLLFNLVLA